MLLFCLLFIAIALTCTMFATRSMMLGFPSLIFWAILGGYAYTQSTADWDIYYFLFIASTLGMTIFCALAMYGLRERHEAYGEEEMEKGEGEYIDEVEHKESDNVFIDEKVEPSKRTQALRERAKKRREGERKPRRRRSPWG